MIRARIVSNDIFSADQFPPIDYELAASIELGNLGRVNLPETPSSVWLMVSHMLFALFLCDIWLEFCMDFAWLVL